jgi:hypothetical protein
MSCNWNGGRHQYDDDISKLTGSHHERFYRRCPVTASLRSMSCRPPPITVGHERSGGWLIIRMLSWVWDCAKHRLKRSSCQPLSAPN